MSVGKASILRAAGAEKAGGKKNQVAQSVLSPMDPDEIQVKFLSGAGEEKKPGEPVQLTEKMPDYLL